MTEAKSEPPARRTVSIGGGVRLPYAEPVSPVSTAMGKANQRSNTKPEKALRSALHRRGLRYRKDLPIRVPGNRPIRPDIVFTRRRVAVFVDGCFWHRCAEHCVVPKSNVDYWRPKLAGNVKRDAFVNNLLTSQGWRVIRVWEHEDIEAAAQRITAILTTLEVETDGS